MAKRKKKQNEVEIDPAEDLKKLLECDEIEDVTEFVSTGSMLLDYAISNCKGGGIPVGRITELIGENQAGKTLIATHVVTETQRKGGIAIFIDIEHDVDKGFSCRIGVNWDKLIYKEYLYSLEDVFDYIEKVVKITRLKHKDELIVIVWDSIAATPAAKELEQGYDPTQNVGLHARIMSLGLRKIRSMIKKERIALICTNQLRTKIGVTFGDNTTTSHGKAMAFYASVRLRLIRTGQIKDSNGRVIGANTEVKVIKNKVGPAHRVAHFPILYDYGVDNVRAIKDYLYEKKVITGSSWKKIEVPNRIEPISFRDADWYSLYEKDKELRDHVHGILEEDLVIKFDKRKIEDLDIDMDSILEVEQIQANLAGKE